MDIHDLGLVRLALNPCIIGIIKQVKLLLIFFPIPSNPCVMGITEQALKMLKPLPFSLMDFPLPFKFNTIWSKIIDKKYLNDKPNMLCCSNVGASPLWKGILCAAQAARMGVMWKIVIGSVFVSGRTIGLETRV
jgi:hypothetical protein